jgi:hypothetical protein
MRILRPYLSVAILLSLLVQCTSLFAQDKKREDRTPKEVLEMEKDIKRFEIDLEHAGIEAMNDEPAVMLAPAPPPPAMEPPLGDHLVFNFVGAESFVHKSIKNAQYSAEAVTERVQTLSDGNRIVQKSSSKIYRDREGRTRRESFLRSIGPWVNQSSEPKTLISINDPIGGANYILEPDKKIARKISHSMPIDKRPLNAPPPPLPPSPPDSGEGRGAGAVTMRRSKPIIKDDVKVVIGNFGHPKDVKKETLGNQMIEGVMAVGTRYTTTIPAEQIGNEREIKIISEVWYSPELQTNIMTETTDPRVGTQSFKLININREDPSPELFTVPPDYKIVDGLPLPGKQIRVIKKRSSDKEE